MNLHASLIRFQILLIPANFRQDLQLFLTASNAPNLENILFSHQASCCTIKTTLPTDPCLKPTSCQTQNHGDCKLVDAGIIFALGKEKHSLYGIRQTILLASDSKLLFHPSFKWNQLSASLKLRFCNFNVTMRIEKRWCFNHNTRWWFHLRSSFLS